MHSPVNHMPHPRFFLTREETRYTHALLGVQTVTCRTATTPQIQGMPLARPAPVEPPPCQ